MLVDALGTEHVVLQSGYEAVTLLSEGASVLEGPVAPTFLIRDLERIAATYKLLRLARSLLDPRIEGPIAAKGPAPWYSRLREALVALDGYHAGATQREIAAALYGRYIVEQAWRQGDFSWKQRVHRAIAKGKALSGGRYVTLL